MPEPPIAEPAPRAGRRELGKIDKRRRIVEAAREVFIEHGYEQATTREIAARAGVSIGTVFVYAKDKRGLLLLIVNDELDAVSAEGQTVLDRPGALIERLLGYFRLRYRYWASEPRLARPALRETFDFLNPEAQPDAETQRFHSRPTLMMGQVEQAVREAQAAGEVDAAVPAGLAASMVVSLYLIEVRRWLADAEPQLDAGLDRLRAVLALLLRGLLPRGAPRTDAAQPRDGADGVGAES